MLRSVVLLAVVAIALPGVAVAQTQDAGPMPGAAIVAQGEASISVAPDLAFVSMATEGHASKTSDAQRIAAQAMTSLQASLEALGIPADAIHSTGYDVQPEYDYSNGRQTLRGFLARHSIEVRVDDFAKVADVVDAAGSSGATSVSGLRFDIKNRDAIEHDALARAVRDGVARATAMAAGAGRTAGPVLRIEESRVSTPRPIAMAGMAPGATAERISTPIAAGQIEIRAQATVTVLIR